MASVKGILCSFDSSSFDRFAAVTRTNRNQFSVYNTNSVNPPKIYGKVTSKRIFTCLAWGAKIGEDPKKKKSVLALGTESGAIVIWDIFTEKDKTLEESSGHNSQVNDVIFNNTGTILYSASEDGHIYRWNLKTGKRDTTFDITVGKQPAKKITLSADNTTLITGNLSIKVWDVSTQKLVKKFSGHTSSIVALKFGGENQLISGANDRFIYLWKIDDTKQSSPAEVLSCSSNPVLVDKSEENILALLENGEVSIWKVANRSKNKSTESAPLQAEGTVSVSGAPILAARFFSPQQIIVGTGAESKMQFQKTTFGTKNGGINSKTILNIEKSTLTNQTVKQQSSEIRKAQQEEKQAKKSLKVLSESELKLPQTKSELTTEDEVKRKKDLEQQMQLLVSSREKEPTSGVIPKADSIQAVLIQAIQGKDVDMLSNCLQITDENIVNNTVRRLPTSYVVRFLEALVERYQNGSQNPNTIVWIRAVLVHHTSYLVTVPNLVSTLSSLYLSMEARLSVFKKLLKLSGRLDLLISQISQQDAKREKSAGEATIYEEESEDEGEGEEGEDEEGDEDDEQNEDDEMDDVEDDQENGEENGQTENGDEDDEPDEMDE